jgi:hypothetical protein
VKAEGEMHLGRFDFTVERAEFCYIERGLEPVTWDLNVYGHCVHDGDSPLFPTGVMLSAQGIPLTLSPADDYTGFALHTPVAAYRDSGQSYFALWIGGEYETWDIDLRLVERKGNLYLLRFEAVTSFAPQQEYERLRITAWAAEVPSRSAPKTDYSMWLRPRSRP